MNPYRMHFNVQPGIAYKLVWFKAEDHSADEMNHIERTLRSEKAIAGYEGLAVLNISRDELGILVCLGKPQKGETTMAQWESALDDRQRKEVELARLYARDFHHGTTGHNQLMLIALLAEALDRIETVDHIGVDAILILLQQKGK